MGKRAIGYFRSEAASGQSRSTPLDQQHAQFVAYCERQGYTIAATFVEPAGEQSPVEGFDHVLTYLLANGEGLVLVIDHVRVLGRDPRIIAYHLFAMIDRGVAVECLADEGGDPLAALVHLWAEQGRGEQLGDRVREAMRRKAIKGEVLGRPPYGYQVGARRRLEPVEDEAEVVRKIFRWYTTDELGIRLIARRLNEEGYRTRRGGNWSMVTIRDILRNRAYIGTFARFGARVPGSHPAIVTNDDFRRVQERMVSRRTAGGPRTVAQFLLSGMIDCGACGGHMIGVSRRQSWKRRSDGVTASAEYRYYQCGSRTNQSICAYHTRRVDQLDDAVYQALLGRLQELLADDGVMITAFPRSGAAERLQARLHALDRDLDRLLGQAVTDPAALDQLRSAGGQWARQYAAAIRAGAAPPWATATAAGAGDPALTWLQSAVEMLRDRWHEMTIEQRRELLDELVERIVVSDDRVEVLLLGTTASPEP